VTPELRHEAEILLADLTRRFPMSYEARIVWKAMRVSAGMAYFRTGLIGLSSRVLDDSEKLRLTLVHEYAHLLAVDRHGRKAAGHGPLWQNVMIELGAAPTVRHRYQVERNQPRQRVTYLCVRCGTLVHRARRLPKRRRYVHAPCGGNLKLQSVEKITTDAGPA
jgi:SprT protein